MHKFIKIISVLALAYIHLSCFCSGRKLNPQLIADSELIFEGKLIGVDTTTDGERDLLLKFKVKKIFKGESQKQFVVRSSNGSCGFTIYKWRHRNLGRTYLLYLTKENGQYNYGYCSNRIAYQSLHKEDMNYDEGKEPKKANEKTLLDYNKELVTLDSLLKIKQ